MRTDIQKAWISLREIKLLVGIGKISYDAGHEFSAPHLKIINDRGKEISKKHGRAYYPLRFNKLMR